MKKKILSLFLILIISVSIFIPSYQANAEYYDYYAVASSNATANIDGIMYVIVNNTANVIYANKEGKILKIPKSISYKSKNYSVTGFFTTLSDSNGSFLPTFDPSKYEKIEFPLTMKTVEFRSFSGYNESVTMLLPSTIGSISGIYNSPNLNITFYYNGSSPINYYYDYKAHASKYIDALIDGIGYDLNDDLTARVIYSETEGDIFNLPSFVEYNDKKYTVTAFITSIKNKSGEYEDVFNPEKYKEIIIPDSVKTVNIKSYDYYNNDVVFKISKSVNEIIGGYNDIKAGEKIKFSVNEENQTFCSNNEFLMSKDKKIIYRCFSDLDEIKIPNGVEKLENYCFFNKKIKEIILPEALTTIGKMCFYGTDLCSINIPQSVFSIGSYSIGYKSFASSIDGFVVYGYSGSVSERYATFNGLMFKSSSAVSGCYHGYNSKITKYPSCTVNGVKTYTCLKCSQTFTKSIPALGHKGVTTVNKKNATYFNSGYSGDKKCSRCEKIISKGKKLKKLKLSTPKVTLSTSKKQVNVKFKKIKDAKKYEININCNGDHRIIFTKNLSYKLKKLEKGKYCEVKVRALITSGKKTAYSNFCDIKKIKVK